MANEQRLIDGNRLKMRMIAFATAIKREYLSIEAIVDTINTEDTVDAVEVVWCKDCKHFHHSGYCKRLGIEHDRFGSDFCSRGERRIDD